MSLSSLSCYAALRLSNNQNPVFSFFSTKTQFMKALFYSEHGPADVLSLGELPDPTIGPVDVLIKVATTAINRLDIVQRHGWYTLPGFSLPHVAGMDMAGTVIELGSKVTGLSVGDRVVVDPSLNAVHPDSLFAGHGDRYGNLGVLGATKPGGYGELCAVSADHVHLLPDDMDFATAAVFPTAWMTTHHALFNVGQLKTGETLLIHGGTSALTLAAVQLAIAAGARVFVSATTDEKCAAAAELGAVTANSQSTDIVSWIENQTGGKGVDMVLDHVGTALWGASLGALGPQGRLVCCGNTTGDTASIPSLGSIFGRGIQIRGSDAYRSTDFANVWSHYCDGIALEQFNPQIAHTFTIDQGAAAQELLESGQALGRIVLFHQPEKV
jgi:NADPH:quinone reductase-like Zn-dependent oxidoreductase